MNKKDIQKVIYKEEINIEYPLNDKETIEDVLYSIGEVIEFPFGVYIRSSWSGDDYWLQLEHYSVKLKKTVIMDYDFEDNFENEEELIDAILNSIKKVDEFEDKIKTLK